MTCTTIDCEPIAPALLADGTPFQLGMTVFLPVGGIESDGHIRCIETNENEHEIDRFVHDGHIYNCLQRIGSRAGTDVSFFYPSREAILDARIKRLESSIKADCAKLAKFRAERIMGS